MSTYKVARAVGARRARVVHDRWVRPRSVEASQKGTAIATNCLPAHAHSSRAQPAQCSAGRQDGRKAKVDNVEGAIAGFGDVVAHTIFFMALGTLGYLQVANQADLEWGVPFSVTGVDCKTTMR